MAADVLSAAGLKVTVAEQMPTVGRKFLMAGKSGLNLTKSEPMPAFLDAYSNLSEPLRKAIHQFGPEDVARWAEGLGQSVFTGSTGRVFPKVMKASPLLRAWLAQLESRRVQIETRWRWTGFEKPGLAFETPAGHQHVVTDVAVFALGGGSWSRLGSDGSWLGNFKMTRPFQPSNCGFAMDWSDHMAKHFGVPIKATKLRAGQLKSRGEWVITKRGIEGGGVYEVSGAVRDGAQLTVDLLPDVPLSELHRRWNQKRPKQSMGQFLKSGLRLPDAKIALFHEVSKREGGAMPDIIKALPMKTRGPFPIDEAISTAGGLGCTALDENFMLTQRSGVFCAGEMLDWDAPTGGYLLTACLASGRAAGLGALKWISELES